MTKHLVAAAIFVAATVTPFAQAPQQSATTAPLAFEVASVKRNMSGDTTTFFQVPPVGTVNITNATLRQLVEQAYPLASRTARFMLVVPPTQSLIRGGSDPREQMAGPRFDIQGKTPEGAEPGSTRAMLQTLLEDRFKLRVHQERRELPTYVLTVAREGRFGQGLRSSPIDCAVFAAERRKNPGLEPPRDPAGRPVCTSAFDAITAQKMTLRSAGQISGLVAGLQSFVSRPIVDSTGLTGSFEWTLTFGIIPEDSAFDNREAGLRTAVREQLGLSLEPRTESYEVLVIDSVEMPTEN